MTEFFYRSGPNEFGPLDAVELKSLAASGRLAPGDEVRRGRAGKWIPAETVQGLFGVSKHRADHAINEMDVVDDLPIAAALAVPGELESQRDTAADTELTAQKTVVARAAGREQSSGSSLPEVSRGDSPRSAAAVVLVCYLTSLIAVAAGIWRLVTAVNELQQILGTVLLLTAIISLSAGCGIGLLQRTLTNLSLSGRNVLPGTGFRGKKR